MCVYYDCVCIVINRPQQRFSDHIPAAVYEESDNISEPKLILKRIRASSGSEKVLYNIILKLHIFYHCCYAQ